jgi:hypothetical protein
MGLIKTLLLKRIVTEKTQSTVFQILYFVSFIAGLFILLFGWNMNVFPPEIKIRVFSILLCTLVLYLFGFSFLCMSEIMKIQGEIKDLKDKIKE